MKLWQFPCSLFFLLALGCGESDQYASYDNTEEVEEFFENKNTEVLAELGKKREELDKELTEAQDAKRAELERDVNNTERRLELPEFFAYS
ncbi:MAG TPA: hypothetical protein DCS85_02805, partial [Verrucomicrobiales bacterium]|nr:hypothetical protein [Verrucomicrobiales bacterium]